MVKMPPKGLFLCNIVALPSGKQEGGNVGLFGQSEQSDCFEVKRSATQQSAEIDLKWVFEKRTGLCRRKCAGTRFDTRKNEPLDNRAFISWPFKRQKLLSERFDGFLTGSMNDASQRTVCTIVLRLKNICHLYPITHGDNMLPKPILKQQNSSTALIDKHIIICISIISCY